MPNPGEGKATRVSAYDVSGLPAGQSAFVRQAPGGGWRLLVAQPGGTVTTRGEFATAEQALARLQADYDARRL